MQEAVSLIGMPGAGKSTLAPLLARMLGYSYLDIDHWITRHTGQSIPSLALQGQSHILSLQEKCVIEEDLSRRVIATPGSIIYTQCLDKLKLESIIIYLEVPLEIIEQRINTQDNKQRVILSLSDGGIDRLYEQRVPMYQRLAKFTLSYQHESAYQSAIRISKLLGLN